MTIQVMRSEEARVNWRDILDKTSSGDTDIVIERYGKPTSAVISYEHYQAIQDLLEELRSIRRAEQTLEAWKQDPSRARPYAEFRSELVAEGLLDDDA